MISQLNGKKSEFGVGPNFSMLCIYFYLSNPLNAQLNPICHLLALLVAHPVLPVSRIRVKSLKYLQQYCLKIYLKLNSLPSSCSSPFNSQCYNYHTAIYRDPKHTDIFLSHRQTTAQLLRSRLKQSYLLQEGVIVSFCRNRQSDIGTYCSVAGYLVY